MSHSKIKRGLILLAIVFIAGNVWAESKHPTNGKELTTQENKEAKSDYQPSGNNATFIYNCTSEIPDQKCNQANNDTDENSPIVRYTGKIADFTVALFIATVALAFVGWRTIKTMQKAEERQLRAYVHVDRAFRVGAHHNHLSFKVMIKNFGQTPAYKCRAWLGHEVSDFALMEKLKKPIKEITTANMLLAPGGEVALESDHSVNIESTIEEINNRKSAVYIFGKIEYIDAFKKSRWTRFRFMYNADCYQSGELFTCNKGNKTDEQYTKWKWAHKLRLISSS